ncbi:hypothetical protein [Solibaculum intestinale]|uniref:ABC transporter permease n=1 Tax=Solibaculum intestinale TaxID=3133165 RepID=A0ABV1E257_9FIRM
MNIKLIKLLVKNNVGIFAILILILTVLNVCVINNSNDCCFNLYNETKFYFNNTKNDSGNFFETLQVDFDESNQEIMDIHNMTDTNDQENKFDYVESKFNQSNVDLIQKKLNMPGRFTKYVYTDNAMLNNLFSSMLNQKNLKENTQNNIELIDRQLKRISNKNGYEYKEALIIKEQLSKLLEYDSQDVQLAIAVNQFSNIYNNNLFLLLVVLITGFGVYSGSLKFIATTTIGIEKYVLNCNIQYLLLVVLSFFIYTTIFILNMLNYNISFEIFNKPIQILEGMEGSVYDLTVLQYVLILVGGKLIYFILFSCVILLISLFTKKNIISLIISAVVVCTPIIINEFVNIQVQNHNSTIITAMNNFSVGSPVMFVTNNIKNIVSINDYINLFGTPVHGLYVYLVVLFLLSLVLFVAAYYVSKPIVTGR